MSPSGVNQTCPSATCEWAGTSDARLRPLPVCPACGTYLLPPARPATLKHRNLLSSAERKRFGCTVTVVEMGSGRTDCLWGTGPVFEVLQEIVDAIDAREGDWKIRCISTPETVYSDIRGGRSIKPTALVEHRYLSEVGRPDLLEPRMRRVTFERP